MAEATAGRGLARVKATPSTGSFGKKNASESTPPGPNLLHEIMNSQPTPNQPPWSLLGPPTVFSVQVRWPAQRFDSAKSYVK